MDRINLRTMAWLSVFTFGQHEGRTVQQVFNLHHTRILRWYYYNCSNISFLPEILRAIGIEEGDEIPKPGKNPEKGKELDTVMTRKRAGFIDSAFKEGNTSVIGKTMKEARQRKRKGKSILVSQEKRERREMKPGVLQARNHGHF